MRKIYTLVGIAAMVAMTAGAQNRANITLSDGRVETYSTDGIESIDFGDDVLTVRRHGLSPVVYNGNVTSISFLKNKAGHVRVLQAAGWLETAYATWENMDGINAAYNVYVRGNDDTDYTRIDNELVRNYNSYGRADVPGLKAGTYSLKILPVIDGAEEEAMATEVHDLQVKAHDRAGFAHHNYSGVGAYTDEGVLKDGAKVIYVNANTAKTVKTTVTTSNKGAKTEYTGFQAILDGYSKGYDSTPIVFRIIGRIGADDMDSFSSKAEGLQIKNNKSGPMNITIEGIGCDATFHGFGMLLRAAESVEVRNLGIMWQMDDGVSCDTDNSHCWIHNCDFFYGQKGSDSDQVKGDGSLDVKGDSQYMTFSYNRFWDSGKSSLCGMTSESGPNYLTYHHNWFDHSDSRHPRIRTMSVHVYNNYFDGNAKYGVGATTGSDVFVEANYFRDCKNPILTSKQGTDVASDSKGTFSGENGGSVKAYGNVMRGKYYYRPYSETNTVEFDAWEAPTRDARMPATVTAKQGGDAYSNWDTDPALMYAYTADDANDVPAVVRGVYGAGRCNHGDFHWRFNNNIQDTNYDVITTLSDAIKNYQSWLIGNYTGDVTIGAGGVGSDNPGGDATEGDEFPYGDYNAAQGGNPDPGEEITPTDYFITSADGGFFRFDSSATETVAQWKADGTLTGGNHVPGFTNADYWGGNSGAYQIAKNGGTVVIKCPSIKTFRAEMIRTGSFAGTVEVSVDDTNYTEVATISGSKGLKSVDWSAVTKSEDQVYVRITNTSSGALNIVGLLIIK